MKNLILTLDYELYGDGTGDLFTDLIKPTSKILKICNEQSVKITIFFEVIEYARLRDEWNAGNKMGYIKNPIEAIENQILAAAQSGHDIQLHVHPQWVNAKYSNGKWELDLNQWRLGDFSGPDGYSIKDLLRDGKKELENLIIPVIPEYKCIALRAGGYNIMPSEEVYAAMKDLGLKIDSSIYPGGFENGSLSKFDYRKVPIHLDYWWADDTDIREISQIRKEVLEIPIFALPVYRWKKVFTVSKIKSLLLRRNASMSYAVKEKIRKITFLEKICYILQKEPYTWDVCMFSKSLHKKFFKQIENKLFGSRNSFVLIGHPKNLYDEKLFRVFLEMVYDRKNNYTFKTLDKQYAEIL